MKGRVQMGRFMQVQSLHMLRHTMMCFSVYSTECKWIVLCRGQKCLFVFAFSTACDRFIEHLLENGRKNKCSALLNIRMYIKSCSDLYFEDQAVL